MMDSHLRQKIALAGAVVLVVVLSASTLAFLIRSDTAPLPPPLEASVADPAATNQIAPRDGPISFQDGGISFTASCQQSSTGDLVHSVSIANDGIAANDFLLEVRLSDTAGPSVSGAIEVDDLGPNEQREITVASERQLVPPATCSITAVEIDRQVIRVN